MVTNVFDSKCRILMQRIRRFNIAYCQVFASFNQSLKFLIIFVRHYFIFHFDAALQIRMGFCNTRQFQTFQSL